MQGKATNPIMHVIFAYIVHPDREGTLLSCNVHLLALLNVCNSTIVVVIKPITNTTYMYHVDSKVHVLCALYMHMYSTCKYTVQPEILAGIKFGS